MQAISANQPKVKPDHGDRGKNLTREDRQRGGRASAAKHKRNASGHFVGAKA